MAASEDYLGVEVGGAGRDAEICELYHAVLVHQQVRALNIAVDHSFIMYIFETHQNLTEITIKNFGKKRPRRETSGSLHFWLSDFGICKIFSIVA